MKFDLDKIADCDKRFFEVCGPDFESDYVNNYLYFRRDCDRMTEDNDCSVMSFATIWGCTYQEAHQHLKMFAGRKNRGGLTCAKFDTADQWCKKTKMRNGPYTDKNRISLGRFCKEHPVGRYWIGVSGHALAVIDGVVYDYKHGPRRLVTRAFRVYGPKEVK